MAFTVKRDMGKGGAFQEDMVAILTSIVADLAALKSAIDAMATKLNADTGVADTDYSGAATMGTTIGTDNS
jgi:hypothetical protein